MAKGKNNKASTKNSKATGKMDKAKSKRRIKIPCPVCKFEGSESHGRRGTKSMGPRQRRMCLKCGHKFTVPHDADRKTSKKKQ